jgi:DNA-directed RNA polymerase specialized sigma24 family protein
MVLHISELNLITDLQDVTSKLNDASCDECSNMPVLTLQADMLPLQDMSVMELADRCMNEIKRFQRGEPSNDLYGIELFHRALKQLDPLAWEVVQHRFSDVMYGWIYQHPMRHLASRFDSEENYVAQAFARFWQATAGNPKIEFMTLAAILRYLRASLNGTILDALRAYSRPREMPLPESGSAEWLFGEEQDDSHEVWEAVQSVLPDKRQQRVAYLLFHCHLKPRQVVQFCQNEFSDVGEIYRLRRNIFERLLRNADHIRWRLGH